eukprot:gi/632940793/ref/XP_007885507.1/ PREDICTED: LOW QUALITY PROTEIN: nuclear receptor subfamily 5 group A member 2-like [Callorhinchus milii]
MLPRAEAEDIGVARSHGEQDQMQETMRVIYSRTPSC